MNFDNKGTAFIDRKKNRHISVLLEVSFAWEVPELLSDETKG